MKKINVRQSLFRTRSSSICRRHESAVWSCSVSGGVEISIVIERSRMFHSDSLLVADAFVSHRFELIICVSRILPGSRMIRQLTVVSSHAVFMTISAAVTTLGTIGLSIWFTAFQVVRQEGRIQLFPCLLFWPFPYLVSAASSFQYPRPSVLCFFYLCSFSSVSFPTTCLQPSFGLPIFWVILHESCQTEIPRT